MRARKKLTRHQKIIRKVVICITSLIIAIVIFFELTVRDRLELSIIAQIKSVSNKAINTAVSDYLEDNSDICSKMVDIHFDENSNVKSISENVQSVNVFKTDIIETTQNAVDNVMKTHGIDVKLGNFTGLNILSDIGPVIPVDIDATSNIMCNIKSSFESSGVNQTLHKITLDLNVDVYVGNPIRIESIKFTTSYEVSQTLIVGTTPSTYGNISTRY